MADFTAADVKKLRDATGAGMMDAKSALDEADGDFDKAVEVLRVKGQAKVAKRGAERTASNGLVAAAEGAMIELGCETDFVAKNEAVPDPRRRHRRARRGEPASATSTTLLAETLKDGRTVAGQRRLRCRAIIGEKLELKRFARARRPRRDLPAPQGLRPARRRSASSSSSPATTPEAARVAAMQVAAMRPRTSPATRCPADAVETERRIAEATAREEGKPEAALPRIVEGRVNGFFKDIVLVEQASVQDPKKSVQAVLDEAGVTVTALRPLRGRRGPEPAVR